MPEDDHRETINALAHSLVRHLRRSLVRAGIIVDDRQLHVVRAFRGSNVRFHTESVGRNRCVPQLILAGSVFIYLYHYYVAISIPRYMMLTWGVSPIKAFVYYGLGAALTIFGLLGLFLLIQKYFKKLTSIIVGYRL